MTHTIPRSWLLLVVALASCTGTADGLDPSQPRTDGMVPAGDVFIPQCVPACGTGKTCSVSGQCIAVGTCVQNEDCKSGELCDAKTGTCVPGDQCGAQELKANLVAPSLLVVLDRSCSMKDLVGGKKKFEIAVAALKALTTKYAGKIRFGLTLFPDITGDKCLQDAIPIPVAAATEAKLQQLLTAALNPADPYYPDGPCVTNIDTALVQAATEPSLKDVSRARFVLLITDGKQASCSAGGGDAGSLKVIQQLKPQQVSTFVVGFGSEVDGAQLNLFADAGGMPSGDPVSHYYKAEDQATLDAALAKIVKQAFGCVFKLQSAPPTLDKLYVFFDGKDVAQDKTHASGWDYDAAQNQVTFYGQACKDLSDGKVADLDIVYGCKKPLDPTTCTSGKTCQQLDDCPAGQACVSSCCTKVID